MAFLTKAARNEDSTDEEENLEELYIRIFPKIGRDFIHRNDLKLILQSFAEALGVDITIDYDSLLEVTLRNQEYQSLLDRGTMPNTVYPDIV